MASTRAFYSSFKTAFNSALAAERAERHKCFFRSFRSSAESSASSASQTSSSTQQRVSTSALDFAPRLKFTRRPTNPRCQPHPTEPCPNAFQQRIRLFLLEAHFTTHCRNHPKQCSPHPRPLVTTAFCRGGGDQPAGRARVKYNLFLQEKDGCERKKIYAEAKAHSRSQQLVHTRLSPPLLTSTHGNNLFLNDNSSQSQYGPVHGFRHTVQKPFYLSPNPRTFSPIWSHPSSTGANLEGARLFSSSRPVSHLPHIFLNLFKSSEALSYINLLFRISVSFIPLSIKRAAMARRARFAGLAAGATLYSPLSMTIAKILCRSALALPFILLFAVLLASLEITPISGRWRLLLLSEKEEKELVDKVLEVGATTSDSIRTRPSRSSAITMKQEEEGARDWLTIMRAVLEENDAPLGTLLGGRVLDSQSDWRVDLVKRILEKLENGIPQLSIAGHSDHHHHHQVLHDIDMNEIHPPNLRYPLADKGRTQHLAQKNAVLVIDRPESNAFSFGFSRNADRREPGVIIVFRGAIDEIMQAGLDQHDRFQKDDHHDATMIQHFDASQRTRGKYANEPNWLSNFFGSMRDSRHLSPHQAQRSSQEAAGDHHVVASKKQEDALAVLLAHELAHLVLSHTIESYASTTLLWPQLERLGWDMLRVLIYPVTAFLGPFVQDAISATVKVGIEESSSLLPALTSSCESRKMETEADLVALRLLANAGIDPRRVLDFWSDRIGESMPCHDHDHGHDCVHYLPSIATSGMGSNEPLQHDQFAYHPSFSSSSSSSSLSTRDENSFIRTHPADAERIQAIKSELRRWERK